MAANLVRVRKFAILYRKIGVCRSSQFAPKFANFFWGYFSYKKEDFKKNPQKNFKIWPGTGFFSAIFLLSVIFYLVSSQFFKKFDSTRSSTPEVWLDSSSTLGSSVRLEFAKSRFEAISIVNVVFFSFFRSVFPWFYLKLPDFCVFEQKCQKNAKGQKTPQTSYFSCFSQKKT